MTPNRLQGDKEKLPISIHSQNESLLQKHNL